MGPLLEEKPLPVLATLGEVHGPPRSLPVKPIWPQRPHCKDASDTRLLKICKDLAQLLWDINAEEDAKCQDTTRAGSSR